jgi:heme-degrading monooxygenase HmoA
MNRFPIAEGREADFEEAWRKRESYLEDVPGFHQFHLLRGSATEGVTLFLSHSQWESHEAFNAWRESDAFKRAHQQARMAEGIVLGHPTFEGYEVVDL